jgi:hypothetical protein
MRGKAKGDICHTAGAWLATRHADGSVTREALHTFDPFALARGRTHHRRLDGPHYTAWKRERMRFQRYCLRDQDARSRLALLIRARGTAA